MRTSTLPRPLPRPGIPSLGHRRAGAPLPAGHHRPRPRRARTLPLVGVLPPAGGSPPPRPARGGLPDWEFAASVV